MHYHNAVGFYGAVSAVDISSDSTRLICGYAKGLVSRTLPTRLLSVLHRVFLPLFSLLLPSPSLLTVLTLENGNILIIISPLSLYSQITHWDLTSYKCLRFITDAHPPGFGVLRVRVSLVYTISLETLQGENVPDSMA